MGWFDNGLRHERIKLISVSHSMAIMSLKTHIIQWRKLKKNHRKMFSQTNYREQDSTKNHMILAKTNLVSKYTLTVQKL